MSQAEWAARAALRSGCAAPRRLAEARQAALLLCVALTLFLACAGETDRLGSSSEPRAIWILETPRLGIGQVSVVERVVVTPPHFWPLALTAPDSPARVAVIDSIELPTHESAERWVHRTQVRLRAEEIGRFEWPASRVTIEGPAGATAALALSGFSLDVQSILPEFAARTTPFGLRHPQSLRTPDAASKIGANRLLVAAGGSAGIVLLGFGIRTLRRLRAARAQRTTRPLPWRTAHSAIARAAAIGEQDPLAAAHELSPALRRYMAARYGADTQGRTCEELRCAKPAFAMRSNWPPFTALVTELDELRFQAVDVVHETAAARLPAWLEAAAKCVDRTIPPEHRQ